MPTSRLGILTASLLIVVLAQGCSAPGFLKRPVDNFKAYYNTFYNARRAYKRGVEGQSGSTTAEAKVERLRYVNIFAGQTSGQASQELDAAVLKSADVLRNHPDSKWVDDALLLIGKSYFHQRNLVGAEQKFREVVELGTGLEDEARFWLGRTLIAAERLEEAEAAIEEALAREDLDSHWESMLRLAKGELRVEEQDWERAALELSEGLEDVPEADVGARAQFLLGQVLETLGRYPEAMQAYRDVDRFRPTYEWSYASQYNAVRVQGLHVDANQALRRLRRMERDDKNYAYRAELLFLRGQIAKAIGRGDDAWFIYDDLLYDQEYAGLVGNMKGRIHYALGELYRDIDRDYVLAAAHFDTAAAQLRGQLTRIEGGRAAARGSTNRPDERWAPEAILDAEEMKEAFGAFAKVRVRVARMDSLLTLSALDDEAFEARILEIRQQLAREMEEERRRQEAIAVQQAFARGAGPGAAPTTGGSQSRPAGRNQQTNAAGFLFHRDAVQAQEGLASFQRTWGDRPLVRDWRRIDAVSRLPEQDLVDEFTNGSERETEKPEDVLPEVDVAAVPRDSASTARMMADLAAARYELANSLFLGIGRPDSAAHWYRLVLDQEEDSNDLSLRALFALAEVQQALGDSSSARSVYERIIRDHPESDFADRGRIRLGRKASRVETPDSLALAEAAYEDAYATWRRGEHARALDEMILVAARHSFSPVQPRSLLAAGLVYLEWATMDDLDLFGPIPFGVGDSTLSDLGLIVPPAADTLDAVSPDSLGGGPAGSEQGAEADTDLEQVNPEAGERPDGSRRRRAVDDFDESAGRIGDVGRMSDADSLEARIAAGRVDTAGTGRDSLPAPDTLATSNAPNAFNVESDDVGVADSVAAPGSIAVIDSVSSTQLDSIPEPQVVVDPDAWRRVTLETLLGHVRETYGNTPYATRAGEVVAGLEARREALAAVADSLAAAAAAEAQQIPDSIAAAAIPYDSLSVGDELAVPDSVAVARRPVAEVPPDSASRAIDTVAVAREAAGANRPPAAPDRERALEDSLVVPSPGEAADSLTLDADVVEVSPLTPSVAPVGDEASAVPDSLVLDSPNTVVPETGPSTWPQVESSTARPLYDVDGVLDTWLVVLETLETPTAAPAALRRHKELLAASGSVEMVTGTMDGDPVLFVVLGRFDSRQDAERAVTEAGGSISEDAWFLHVIPR